MTEAQFSIVQAFAGWLFVGSGIGVVVSVWFSVSYRKRNKCVICSVNFVIHSKFWIEETERFLV